MNRTVITEPITVQGVPHVTIAAITHRFRGPTSPGAHLPAGPIYCSFCGKSQDEVKKLAAGPTVYICNECVSKINYLFRSTGIFSEFDSAIGQAQELTEIRPRITAKPIFELMGVDVSGTVIEKINPRELLELQIDAMTALLIERQSLEEINREIAEARDRVRKAKPKTEIAKRTLHAAKRELTRISRLEYQRRKLKKQEQGRLKAEMREKIQMLSHSKVPSE